MMVVHQCERFFDSPKLIYEKAAKHIVKYLLGIRHVGTHANTNVELGLMANADPEFANGRNKLNLEDVTSLFSKTKYATCFMGMPIV